MKKWFVGILSFCSILFTACGMERTIEKEQMIPWKAESTEQLSITNGETVEETNPKMDLRQSIIQIKTPNRLGSGILWEKRDEDWIVVTAAHVVEGLQEADVYLVSEDRVLPAKVTEVRGLDLAFLTVPIISLESSLEAQFQSMIGISDSPEDKARVLAVGYNPYGAMCEFTGTVIEDWIYVEDFDNYMILCDCGAVAGMSGGAIVTEDRMLVGMVCGENDKGILAVLPIGVIESEYALFREN